MQEKRFYIDDLLGPIVTITIGLSFADADRLPLSLAKEAEIVTYAVISPAERRTLVSRELSLRLDKVTCVGVSDYQSITLPGGSRAIHYVTIRIGDLAPRSIDAVAAELMYPIECVIGRDMLNAGWFIYRGSDGEFDIRM